MEAKELEQRRGACLLTYFAYSRLSILLEGNKINNAPWGKLAKRRRRRRRRRKLCPRFLAPFLHNLRWWLSKKPEHNLDHRDEHISTAGGARGRHNGFVGFVRFPKEKGQNRKW
jgi:hypothetical protein